MERIILRLLNTVLVFSLFISVHKDITALGKEKNFCSTNLFENNVTWLDFTKEVNTIDYVVIERYKELSCCAKNYTKIEWYKDGKKLSTDLNFPTFNNFLENNQTLFSKRVNYDDNGTYTCKVYNDTNVISKSIKLSVMVDKKYMKSALLTYPSEDVMDKDKEGCLYMEKYAEVGDSQRFLCEGFVGYGNEHESNIAWVFKNNTFVESKDNHLYTKDIRRDENMTLGQYLYFRSVVKSDFTTYLCTISNGYRDPKVFKLILKEGVDPKNIRTEMKPTLIVIATFLCTSILVLTAYRRWHLELHLFWKDRFGKIEDDNKEYDVFVCYDQSDADFAIGVIVHILENVYGYKCFAYERDSIAGEWMPEIYTTKIKSCRRFLMVLSKALANNSWCTYALYIAIEAMLNLHSKIICIELEDIPWNDLQRPENVASDLTLQQVLKVVRKVRWQPSAPKYSHSALLNVFDFHKPLNSDSDSESLCEEVNYGSEKFWTSLRIHLPPKRHSNTHEVRERSPS
ncbi:hypothetical protein C0J52_04602 [Blattella germanica]|nr:hypothetical protein C0J52_04602 [Blattella germanica]